MEEETKEIDATASAAATEELKADETGQNNGRPQRKRDETPIEDLYDLSKPIPRVERPNKDAYEAELAEISAAFDVLKEERRVVQETIDQTMESNKGSEIGKQREAMSQLRSTKGALIDEKKAFRAQLDAMRSQADKIVKDKKDAKSNVRFSSIGEIDAEIAKLQRRQETTSMSLNEEKRLIKEMDALQASKKLVADLKDKDADLEGVKEKRKAISAQISAKDKEIDAVSKQIDEKSAIIKGIADKETDKRDNLKALFSQRDELRKKMNVKLKEKDAVRQVYREKNNSWYNYQRAVRAQKKMQYEEEKKVREAEKAAWLKRKEEEELKKIPYEEEMALCDYLADYLTRTYLTKEADKVESGKESGVVALDEDPFAGFKPVNKKDEGEEYFGKGKGKKKRNRNKDKAVAARFTLNVDTFEQFGLLNLNPPTSLDAVEKSVEELRAKKKWYSEQPRGSVPTATDIRKANERAAAKLRTQGGEVSSAPKPKQSNTNFSLSTDDFAPLGSGSASASLNATWGQKAEISPAADEMVE